MLESSMKRKFLKIVLVFTLLLAAILIGILFLPGIINKTSTPNTITPLHNINIETLEEPEEDFSKDVSEVTQTAWIPYWDFDRGYESLVASKDKFESVSPVWYTLKEDGTLKSHKKVSHAKLQTFTKENNIKLIPAIDMFNFKVIKAVLNSEENYDRHIASILKIVDDNDYDGIDIDYESIEVSEKELFLQFIKDLSIEMKSRDKVLTIDVLTQWGDGVTYPSLVQTREVQDWEELSKYVDEVRIMAYDYTSSKSQYPGPIGPIPWIYIVLQYAVEKIPREKIVLGVHLYGYEWIDKEYNPIVDILGNPLAPKIQVNSKEFADITEIKNTYEFTERFDDGVGEAMLEYNKDGSPRFIFYINGRGVTARKEMAAQFGIKGVAYWRLGG